MSTDDEFAALLARAQAAWCLSEDAAHALADARSDCETLIAEVRLLRAGISSIGGHPDRCPVVWDHRGAKCTCLYGLLRDDRKLGER